MAGVRVRIETKSGSLFIPEVLDGVEVRTLSWGVKFFHTKLGKSIYLFMELVFVHEGTRTDGHIV